MTMLSEQKLANIRRRAEEATPAPWEEGEADMIYATDRKHDKAVPLFHAEVPVAYFVTNKKKPLDPDLYLCAEEMAAANRRFVAAARRDVPALIEHTDELQQERDRLSAIVTHPDAHRLTERIAELEQSEKQLMDERNRLYEEHELLRKTVGEVRAKLHAAQGGKISFPFRKELRGLCDLALQGSQPRAWRATHRNAQGMVLKQLFEAINVDTDEQITVYESLDGRKWTSRGPLMEEKT